jgi:hypothetical protein
VVVLTVHVDVRQGLPVASIVVTAAPSVETTLTFLNMRTASWYVPGRTRTVPPPGTLRRVQIASWILQKGVASEPSPAAGQVWSST